MRLRWDGAEVLVPLSSDARAISGVGAEPQVAIRALPGSIRIAPLEEPDDDLATFTIRFTAQFRDDLGAL